MNHEEIDLEQNKLSEGSIKLPALDEKSKIIDCEIVGDGEQAVSSQRLTQDANEVEQGNKKPSMLDDSQEPEQIIQEFEKEEELAS